MHHGKFESITIVAGADLTAQQYKIITVAGVIAANAAAVAGVLMSKPESGQHAQVAYSGHMKAYAGGVISAGNPVTVTTSGYLAAVASGGGVPVGRALTDAASGDIFDFIGDFAVAHTST